MLTSPKIMNKDGADVLNVLGCLRCINLGDHTTIHHLLTTTSECRHVDSTLLCEA